MASRVAPDRSLPPLAAAKEFEGRDGNMAGGQQKGWRVLVS